MASLDPRIAIYDVSTLEERVERSVVNERLIATLSTILSAMATLLSVVGLYGVMAYMVSRRTREIGIRMALGALSSQIARAVLREASVLVAIGLAVGFGAAWWLGRYVQSQLYGVTPADTATFLIAALMLTAVAGLASALPARRAARVTPMSALRDE
jgi:ABC-type antimicrobial peptide transport system permease subunit